MLRSQKCSSWSVCEITLKSQELNCRQRCFSEGSVDCGRRRKVNCRSGLFLPVQSINWARPFPCCPRFGALCSLPHKLLLEGCCSSCLLVTFNEPLFNSQGMTALTWITSKWVILCTTTDMVHGLRKKETSPELSYHWILNTQFGGAQTWGTVAENALSSSLAAAAVQVLWNVWYLGGSFRSRSNSTANLHWKQVFICLIVKILQPAKSRSSL